MKIRYLIGILTIILLVGCAAQVEKPAAEAPATGAVTTPTEEVEPTPEAETVAEGGEEEIVGEAVTPTTEVDVTPAGFDPAEIKISVGDTVTLTSTDKVLHIIRGNELFTVRKLYRAGNQYAFIVDTAGEYEILDQTARSTLKITAE